MDLLQVIIPNKDRFFVLLPNGEKVSIQKYNKIDIDFCDRIVYKNGEREVVQSPVITYRVKMDQNSKDKLKTIFSDCFSGTEFTVQTRKGKIQVGEYNYIFNVDITARPDMRDCLILSNTHQQGIKICLKLENTNITLFTNAEEAYEEYNSRFDLLDLR